jgi:hypothetical protein
LKAARLVCGERAWKGTDMNSNSCCLEPARIERFSVCTVSRKEADCYKWIKSEEAGCDLGESALKQWVKDHWWGFLRARWIEHLQGSCFWIELGETDFGLLLREFPDQRLLLNQIISHLINGKENLDIIYWAQKTQIAIEPVIHILERLDINGHRLILEYDQGWIISATS